MNNFDITIFRWFNSWVAWSPLVANVVSFRARFLPWAVIAGLIVFVLVPVVFAKYRAYATKNARIAALSLISAGVARYGVVEILRFFVVRPRPFEVLDGVYRLIASVSDGSFPSGHAAAFFALATPIAFYYRKTALLFFFLATVISVDRVIGGVHWPSDILGGAIVGIATAWFICWCFRKYGTENKSPHLSVRD
ncbi:MAG: phosphatase PAP2 family protein [bacterium]|nr:phosphatase PAP2 family protein [bacterium]